MDNKKELIIDRVPEERTYTDRNIYRKYISVREKFCYRLKYRYTDLLVTSDKEIGNEIKQPLVSFYNDIEKVIASDEDFSKSLGPVKPLHSYPPVIKEMCRAAGVFGVGPMAAVAGAVCDSIAESVSRICDFLMIENGGDVYIKSSHPVSAGLFSSSRHFPQSLNITINPGHTPCGICSSSGVMGHSLSMGKSDLVTVMSHSTAMADAAATAIANSVTEKTDVDRALHYYKDNKYIKGLVIIKDDRLAVWGALQLA